MGYSVILLDADGTLFDFDKAEELAFLNLLKDINLHQRYDDLFPIYFEENRKIWFELEQGQITQQKLKVERFKRFITAANITGDPIYFAQQFMAHLANASILYDDAFSIIRALSKTHTLLIVTNGLKEVQHKRVRLSTLAPYVEATVISDEIHISKPDPRIIEHALKIINHSKKDDVVIVGDGLHSDIQGGYNAGIDTIWFNPTNKDNTLSFEPTHTIQALKELLDIV